MGWVGIDNTGSDGACESDSVASVVEVGVEGLDEAVSQDEGFSQLGRQVQTDQSDDADGLASLIHLQDVVLSSEGVLVAADDEVQSGQVGYLSAVNLLFLSASEGLGHVVDDLGGSNDDGCSSVDNAEQVADLVAGAVEDDVVHGDGPVVVHLEGVVLERASVVLGVDSSQDQGRAVLAGHSSQVEGEGVGLNLALLIEQVEDEGQAVHGDGGPCHTEDAVELGGEEADTMELGDLGEEGLLGLETSDPGGVLTDETGNCT